MYASGPVAALSRAIQRRRRQVTVLFSDIEGSTRYWDRYGDVEGRLMVDRHNRLTFPVVRHFRGRIVKTIGDALMAIFDDPRHALDAAIAMQQVLAARRREHPDFDLHVRIGMHTGTAVVERRDVFGDVVNVASRLQGLARGDDILLSGATARAIGFRDQTLRKRDDFRAKGKRRAVPVWECDWRLCANRTASIRLQSLLPLAAGQKMAVAACAVVGCVGLYLLYIWYGRYLLSDWEWIALFALNPVRAMRHYWWILPAAGATLAVLAFAFARVRTLPIWVLRLVQGGAGMTVALVAAAGLAALPPLADHDWLNEPVYASSHLFVEARAAGIGVRPVPELEAEPVLTVERGELLLLADVAAHDGITWNRVLIAPREWGWVPRVLPPARGHPETRLTWADKFYFRRVDAYTLLFAGIGLLVGMRRFVLQPF